jgi:ABC-type uncharacterized transport system involved in gliding motility auxiliary subunit
MHAGAVMTTIAAALGGAGGLGALMTPVLVHLTARRMAAQTENTALIADLQEERDHVVARLDQRDATVVALWDYVLMLRYSLVKGLEPPTLPAGLSVGAIHARIPVPTESMETL